MCCLLNASLVYGLVVRRTGAQTGRRGSAGPVLSLLGDKAPPTVTFISISFSRTSPLASQTTARAPFHLHFFLSSNTMLTESESVSRSPIPDPRSFAVLPIFPFAMRR